MRSLPSSVRGAIALALAFLVVSSRTYGQERTRDRWTSLGRFGSDMKLSADLTRIAILGEGEVEVWTRSLYDRGQTLESKPGAKYVSTLTRYRLRCGPRRVFAAEVIFYDSDGDVMHSFPGRDPAETDWSGVAPSTMGEAVLDAGCASFNLQEQRRKAAETARVRREGNSDVAFAYAEASTSRKVFCPRDPYRSPDIYPEGLRIFFVDTADARKYGFRRDTSAACRAALKRPAPDSSLR